MTSESTHPWSSTPLSNSDLFEFESGVWTGKKPPLATCSVLRNTNFDNDGTLDFSDVAEIEIEARVLKRKTLLPGDIILERSGGGPTQPVGRVAFFDKQDKRYCFSNFTTRLRVCKPEVIDSHFLHLYLHLVHLSGRTEKLQRRTTGIRNLDFGEYLKLPIPLPSLPVQRAVAHILLTVQEAREARYHELALERERNAALMKYLFTHGTRGELRKRTDIGDLPDSWTVLPFAEVVQISSGQVDPRKEPYASMPHVGPDNIEADTGRLLPTKTARECSLISGKYLFTKEDVLYSKIRPYLRKAAIPEYAGICSADMYALRGKAPLVDREFLYHYLLSESFTNRAIAFQNRTGIPKINREQLGQIDVPIPGSEEQQEIGSVLTGCKRKADALQQEILVLGELFSSLLDELMTGKVHVEPLIDGGTPNE